MRIRFVLSFVLCFLSLQLCLAQSVSHYSVQCPTIGGPCRTGLADTAAYANPTILTISGYVQVIFPTTDGLGSTIDVTGIVTTNRLAQPSTSYLPITNVVTGSVGSETTIQLPLTDGQGSLVILTGVFTTNRTGQTTTSFQALTVTNSGSTGLLTEVAVPTTQSGGSVGYGLGTLSSASGHVETVIGGILYQPLVPQATATGSADTATASVTRLQATVASSDSTDGAANGQTNTGTTVNGSWNSSRSTGSVQSQSIGPQSNSPPISSSQQTNSSRNADTPVNNQSSGSGQSSTFQPVATSVSHSQGYPSATPTASTKSSSTGIGQSPAQVLTSGATGPITPAASLVSSTSAAGLGYYPSTVTFVTTHDGTTDVGIAFLTTTSSGRSIITNSIPSQSAVGTGLVVVTIDGTTTTVTLSSLPTPEPLPGENSVQVVSESGVAVTYSPRTLSGFANLTAPFEISTAFVETVNGHRTTQAGWWLIGAGGVINPPSNRPWAPPGPGGIRCLGGPLFCDPSIIIIGGGLGIRLPRLTLPKGTIGPPGYPGGKISGGSDPGDSDPDPDDDPPPPYEEPGDETDEDKTDDQQKKKTATDKIQTTDHKTSDKRTTRKFSSQSTPESDGASQSRDEPTNTPSSTQVPTTKATYSAQSLTTRSTTLTQNSTTRSASSSQSLISFDWITQNISADQVFVTTSENFSAISSYLQAEFTSMGIAFDQEDAMAGLLSSTVSNTAMRSSESTTLNQIFTLSFSTSGSSTQSTTATGVAEYFIIAASGAAQAEINALLERWDPSKGTVQPDVGSTDASGGTWIDYALNPQEAQSLLSRNDIILIETCASVAPYPPDSLFTTMSTTKAWNATLVTLESDTGQVTSAPLAKERRGRVEPVWREAVATQPPSSGRSVSGTGYVQRPRDFRFSRPSPNEERDDHGPEHNAVILGKRDPGTQLVRQENSNEDLSVLAQAPGVLSVDDVDYIFQETKGENTWVYLVDVGVDQDNYVSHHVRS